MASKKEEIVCFPQISTMTYGGGDKGGQLCSNCKDSVQCDVRLTSSEIAFVFLMESQAVAFQPLKNLAIIAIKTKFPTTWKEILSSCLFRGVEEHVTDQLENLEDLFVVCKLLRSRLNEVTDYVGAELFDAHDKERLSLQVQGVEATRHMAFHDILRTCYSHESRHNTVGWFCEFLMKMADHLQRPFLKAKYQAYYVEHLKDTDQLSEALEQARLLQNFLTDEFGDDYLEWLEEAPDASALIEAMEALVAEQ